MYISLPAAACGGSCCSYWIPHDRTLALALALATRGLQLEGPDARRRGSSRSLLRPSVRLSCVRAGVHWEARNQIHVTVPTYTGGPFVLKKQKKRSESVSQEERQIHARYIHKYMYPFVFICFFIIISIYLSMYVFARARHQPSFSFLILSVKIHHFPSHKKTKKRSVHNRAVHNRAVEQLKLDPLSSVRTSHNRTHDVWTGWKIKLENRLASSPHVS